MSSSADVSSADVDVEIGVARRVAKAKGLTKCGLCFGGSLCLSLVVGLVIILCSISTLGPDDQVLIHNHDGDEVVNGPGTKLLNPFREKTWRKAMRLGELQYARIEDRLSGESRHEEGPTMIFLGAYDDLRNTNEKIVLKKDEYIRFVEGQLGTERIIKGPKTVVPSPTETTAQGKQQAVFLDTDSAAVVVDKTTGMQKLVKKQGVFFPGAYEDILAVRELIHVLPHEAVVERDESGKYTVHNGSSSFFLPPYHELLTMMWSSYSDPIPAHATSQAHKLVNVTKIDMRARMMFFTYEVRTMDNVKLRLDGNIFWRVKNVRKMIETSSDPEGEVWQHSRSALIQGVSQASLSVFMATFNNISMQAFETQAADGFYADRGVEIISMEITHFQPVDEQTAEVLQKIIQETTNRINRLEQQNSENDVKAAKLAADIQMEKQRTELIETQAKNFKLESQMQGESGGEKRARGAAAFLNGLNNSLPNVSTRVELYKLHETLENNRANTENLASGKATLFLTPQDLKLKLHMDSMSGAEL